MSDYKVLSQMWNLPAGDRKIVQQQLKQLPARTKAAQDREMGEMMGKLKEVSFAEFAQILAENLLLIARQWYPQAFWSVYR